MKPDPELPGPVSVYNLSQPKSGNDTLLNILGLLDNPTSGSYELLGTEVGGLKEKERTIDLFDGQIVSDVKNEL